MPKGNYDRQIPYTNNSPINKSIEKIYADLDAYTVEKFADEPEQIKDLNMNILLPPCLYEGKLIKGLYYSEGVDIINQQIPQISHFFLGIANSQWCSYPWSQTADAYFGVYPNFERENWFKRTHPEHFRKIIIPTQDAEYINEYRMIPLPQTPKKYDLICVSRLSPEKNLPMLTQAIKTYQQKYNQTLKMLWLYCDYYDINKPETMNQTHQKIWHKMTSILDNIYEYITPLPMVNSQEITHYYNSAKIGILGSLLEGTNRSIHEAMSCNIPVICFADFNKYLRGQGVIIPPKAGLYAPFDPEGIADTIYLALQNLDYFKPRQEYLTYFGRRNFFNLCLDSFDYYRENIPNYQPGKAFNNLWLDLAIQHQYQVNLFDFIYNRLPELSTLKGIDQIRETKWIGASYLI